MADASDGDEQSLHRPAGADAAAGAGEPYATTRVGDATDTSPYVTDNPPIGISVGTYIQNMAVLSQYLAG